MWLTFAQREEASKKILSGLLEGGYSVLCFLLLFLSLFCFVFYHDLNCIFNSILELRALLLLYSATWIPPPRCRGLSDHPGRWGEGVRQSVQDQEVVLSQSG